MGKIIKDILPNILNPQANWKLHLLNNWQQIWGSLSSKVHLEKIDKNLLVIGVHDSCWLQELHSLSHVLLHTINKALDVPRIEKIRFKKVEPKITCPFVHKKQPFTQKIISHTLSTKERAALDRIKDPQLCAALQTFLIRCNQENV